MTRWNRLSLNAKFLSVLSIFALGAIVISSIGILKLQQIDSDLEELVEVVVRRVMIAKDMDASTNDLRNQEKAFLLQESPEEMKKAEENLDQIEKELSEEMDRYDAIASEAGKQDIAKLKEVFADWRKDDAELRKLAWAGKRKEAVMIAMGSSLAKLNSFDTIVGGLVKRNVEKMKEEEEDANHLVETSKELMITVSFFSLAIGFTLAFFILRAVNRAIDRVISTLDESSLQVSAAAQQMAASSEQLSQASTEQAASLQQTSSAIEEINSILQKSSENSRRSSSEATSGSEVALQGKGKIQEMLDAIAQISGSNRRLADQMEQSNRRIAEVVQVINEIGSKTQVINDIVFQTKLLSFNASVEAARAGESGKGFAIVAEEVGSLAQMSGSAAKEIRDLLGSSISKVEEIVSDTKSRVEELVDEGRSKIDFGSQVAASCGTALDGIVGSTSQISQMIGAVAAACDQQAQGVQEITQAMNQLDQVAQENTQSTAQVALSAQHLSGQAVSLREAVKILVKTVKGGEGDLASGSERKEFASARPVSGDQIAA